MKRCKDTERRNKQIKNTWICIVCFRDSKVLGEFLIFTKPPCVSSWSYLLFVFNGNTAVWAFSLWRFSVLSTVTPSQQVAGTSSFLFPFLLFIYFTSWPQRCSFLPLLPFQSLCSTSLPSPFTPPPFLLKKRQASHGYQQNKACSKAKCLPL